MNTTLLPADCASNGAVAGEAAKQAALALLESRRAALIRRGRRLLLELLLERGAATADCLRDRLPIPPEINPKLTGPIFAGLADLDLIRQTGWVKSRRPEAHRRPVGIWELANPAGARVWLLANPELPDPEPAEPTEELPLFEGDF